jgi:hydrogenase nickel incorporation protein HypA/HybF
MHELSICRALVRDVQALAFERNAKRVSRIHLRVGPLSGIEPALLLHAFPSASTGSLLEGATLQVDEAPVLLVCESCAAFSTARANDLRCGACGDWHTRLAGGDELMIESVELITEAAAPEAPHV